MIDSWYFIKIIVGLSIGTFAIRSSAIFLSDKLIISDRVREIFSFIPAAILPGLIAPLVFYHKGNIEIIFGKERFFITLLAATFCYKSKSMLLTILLGLVVLYSTRLLY